MGIASSEKIDAVPPFATVRRDNGVTQITVRTKFAKWLKAALAMLPVVLLVAVASLVRLINIHETRGMWPGWLIVSGEAICGIALIFCWLFGFSCLLASSISTEVILNGDTLHLKDRSARFQIPVSDICSIRHIAYPGDRLECDVSGPPAHLFFRARRTAMELRLPDGQIEFFQFWEEPKVAWLVKAVNGLLFPMKEVQPPAVIDPRSNRDVVVAGRLYGKARRSLMWSAIVVGSAATLASGSYAYIALNSNSWPSTQGRVLRSDLEQRTGSREETYYTAEIQYSYKVFGETYNNDSIGFERGPGDAIIQKLIDQHPRGSPITVFYNPSRPADSVVIPGLAPDYWLIFGLCVMPLILAIPLVLRRTTLAQDQLSERYQVRIPPNAMLMEQMSASIRWSMPEDAWRASILAARRSSFAMGARVLVFTALALWAAHYWMADLCPPDFPWIRTSELLLVFPVLLMLAATADTFLSGKRPPNYGLNSKGVVVPSKETRLIRWNQIVCFDVQMHPLLPSYRVLTLYLSTGLRRVLVLPGGEVETAVLSELNSRLPYGLPPPRLKSLSPVDWFVGFALTAAVIWVGQTFLIRHLGMLHYENSIKLIVAIGLLAGPGSWIALILWNRRARIQLRGYAVVLNLFATFGTLLATIVKHFSQTTK